MALSFAAGSYVVVDEEASPKEPFPPYQIPCPGVVVTSIFAISLLQMVYGPPGIAVAGVLIESCV